MTLNVLHLIDHYRVGGPGKTIINSARFIDPHRFCISAASFCHQSDPFSEFALAVQKAGVPYLRLSDHRFIHRDQIQSIRKFIALNKISILHSHGYKANFLALAAYANRPSDIIKVSTYHGWIANNLSQQTKNFIDLFWCRFFDGIIAVSHQIHSTVQKYCGRTTPSVVIQNAIVLEDYRPQGARAHLRTSLSISPDDIVIGVFGRLSIEKGCREMLTAFDRLSAMRPNLKLLFVGEGPLLGALQSQAQCLPNGKNILFAGYQRDIAPFYEVIDVLVCPSRTEGISNVILEAMAFGVPIVATAVGGNPEIITNRENGLLVAPMAIDEIATAIASVLESRDLSQRLSKAAKATVARQFSFQSRMRKVEAFYNRLTR